MVVEEFSQEFGLQGLYSPSGGCISSFFFMNYVELLIPLTYTKKNDCPILSHTSHSESTNSLRESDAGAGVGFSPWSAILFPVVSWHYEIYAIYSF